MNQNLVALMNALATAIGLDYKTLNAAIGEAVSKTGDLTLLTGTQKTNLVAAINELRTNVGTVESQIIDAPTIQGMIDTGLNGLVDGAPDALNTLNEIAAALAEDDSVFDSILLSLAKRVRVDAVQNFTETEKAMGRDNIGAAKQVDVGDVANADPVATYHAAKV